MQVALFSRSTLLRATRLRSVRLYSEPKGPPKGWGKFDFPKKWSLQNPAGEKKEGEQPEEKPEEKDFFRNFFKNNKSDESEKKSGDDGDGGGGDGGGGSDRSTIAKFLLAFLGVGLGLYFLSRERGTQISYEQFQNSLLALGYVESLEVINKTKVRVHLKPPNTQVYYFTISGVYAFEQQLSESLSRLGASDDSTPVRFRSKVDLFDTFILSLPILGFGAFLFYSFGNFTKSLRGGGGGIFKMGKSKHILWTKGKVQTKFADVAGCDEAKEEIKEFVNFLKSPKRFEALGAKIPKGAILVGPPGTGKTLLAKATAGEAGVPFFSVSGSDFVEIYGGIGPARVRDLFKEARGSAPCIVFIDEIDAIGRKRGGNQFNRNDERENTLNQLLVEMDGFSSNKGIIVLAGTNRNDILDEALLRPGRFDRHISIDLPDVKSREAVFRVHLKGIKYAKDLDTDNLAQRLAALTPGFSGADISNVCNEAALIAARFNKEYVTLIEFEAAVDRVIAGLEKKSKIMSPKEKQVVAYHEAGHALAGWLLPFADPVLKVSIIPRGSAALGFSQQLPEERHLHSQEYIHSRLGVLLAGRAAEQIKFGEFTSGAQDDLQKVTRLSYDEILTYGMNTTIGSVSFNAANSPYAGKPYSETTAQLVDSEVTKRVSGIYEEILALLRDNFDKLEMIAKILIEKELINHDDIRAMLGPPRARSSPEHEKYLSQLKVDDDTIPLEARE